MSRTDDRPGPDHPFWPFSLEIYARPGAAPACLALQDRYGLDVNLLLFCLWSGAAGRSAWRPAEMRALIDRVGRWQADVVRPLRRLRRRLKQGAVGIPAGVVRELRRELGAVELGCERIEQLLIAAAAGDRPPAPTDAEPVRVAAINLAAYVAATGAPLERESLDHLAAVLRAAFPGSDPEPVERLLRAAQP